MGRVECNREEDIFQKVEISNLISDWERRAGGGEGKEELALPAVEERGRRRSQEFTNLRLKFIELGDKEETSGISAKPDVTLSTERSSFRNLHSISTLGRGAVRKLFSRNLTHSMEGRDGTLLARPSANSKRKWDTENWDHNPKRHCGL